MDQLAMYIFTITPSHTNQPSQSINHVALSSTDWPMHLQFSVQCISWHLHIALSSTDWPMHIQFSFEWIGQQCTYIALSSTNRPSQSINVVAWSSTDQLTHLQFNVQWIGWQCTYSPLLHLIPTSHPNPLTMLLHLVPTG